MLPGEYIILGQTFRSIFDKSVLTKKMLQREQGVVLDRASNYRSLLFGDNLTYTLNMASRGKLL